MKIGTDKILHAVISFTLTVIFATLITVFWNVAYCYLGFFLAWLIGFGRELYQTLKNKTPFNIGDMLANTIGVVAGAVFFSLVILKFLL